MSRIDDVITAIPAMTAAKRAVWAANAARVIAKGPRRSPAYADALRLRDALTVFEAACPAEDSLIAACGLDWDRTTAGRTTFRGFDGGRLVARVIRVRPGKFIVQVRGAALPRPYTTLSAARAAAAEALHAGAEDARVALPRAA
ncbi:hypothetical protein Rumeso_04414 [Rubellimicrobium mesophilum DSM 19309]|uniref:Uncharacterized protein n=1 Tax=Rubellimicrobium mesophilum DSM 19309 TaxID=442562 RepID=A0A017HIV7_9RHOB|nr:hypothetical protein [Rubellimicrobium mesophilum]EYD74043.1 hypothetical protein Rumeso_04414 [Rubellimicrobium mesophilum DSM 19309]